MKRDNFTIFFLGILLLATCCSCQHTAKAESKTSQASIDTAKIEMDSVLVKGNMTRTTSASIEKLGEILNLKTCRPMKVKFKYMYFDNSGGNQRLSSPGPSDFDLEAILYFDSATFKKIIDFDKNADFPPPAFDKDDFMFDWLNKDILTELENSDKNYHGHPDFFFGTSRGKCWHLKRKILIKWAKM